MVAIKRVLNSKNRALRGFFVAIFFIIVTSTSSAWLFEKKAPPWSSVYNEALAAFSFSALSLAILIHQKLKVSVVSLLFLCCAGLPWFQYAIGVIAWWGDAVVVSLYLGGFWLVFTGVQNLRWVQRQYLLQGLLTALVLASVASVALQGFQLSGLPIDWVRRVDLNRPSANLAQPNLLASLQLLGVLALNFLRRSGRITYSFFTLLVVVLTAGMALTGSRAALVGAVVLACWHGVAHWRGSPRASRFFYVFPVLLLVGHALVWWIKTEWGWPGAAGSALNPPVIRMGSSLRLDAWSMLLHQVLERPWLGYGIHQTGQAHLLADSHTHPFGAHFQQAHNLVLDVLLWVGLPLGLLLVGAGGYVVVRALRWRNERQMLASSGMLVLLNHSMLEFPLYYSYFLLPFAVLLAYNSPVRRGIPFFAQWSRQWLLLPAALLLALTLKLVWDHRQVERLMLRWGLHQMVSSQPFDFKDVDLGLMAHWEKLLYYSMKDLHIHVQEVDVEDFERTALRFPTVNILLNYAIHLTLKDKPIEAQLWLQRACSVHSEQHCSNLRRLWMDLPQLRAAQPNPEWRRPPGFE